MIFNYLLLHSNYYLSWTGYWLDWQHVWSLRRYCGHWFGSPSGFHRRHGQQGAYRSGGHVCECTAGQCLGYSAQQVSLVSHNCQRQLTIILFCFRYETPPIYNYVPDQENMVSWRRYMEDGFEYGCDIPMRKSIWYPRFTIVPHMWQYHILCFLYHTLPALVMDTIMVLIGKKPR